MEKKMEYVLGIFVLSVIAGLVLSNWHHKTSKSVKNSRYTPVNTGRSFNINVETPKNNPTVTQNVPVLKVNNAPKKLHVRDIRPKKTGFNSDFGLHHGYVRHSNSPDAVNDFLNWYLAYNYLFNNGDVDFEQGTFLGFPNAEKAYIENNRVHFVDSQGNEIGHYDLQYQGQEITVTTDDGTYSFDTSGDSQNIIFSNNNETYSRIDYETGNVTEIQSNQTVAETVESTPAVISVTADEWKAYQEREPEQPSIVSTSEYQTQEDKYSTETINSSTAY